VVVEDVVAQRLLRQQGQLDQCAVALPARPVEQLLAALGELAVLLAEDCGAAAPTRRWRR
jgi:hypothetical protein